MALAARGRLRGAGTLCAQTLLLRCRHRLLRRSPARALGAAASSMAPSVQFSPAQRSLFDEPLAIVVQGLCPQQAVTLRLSLQDEAGELFQSCARYQAESSGELDLTSSPALPGGSFCGLEPMGLLWSLQPQKPFLRLVKRDVQSPFCLELEVFEGHGPVPRRLLARSAHERGFLRDGVRRILVREGGSGPHSSCLLVKGPGIGLLGISKGGDLCISMASFLKGITATVTINGSVANVAAVLHYKDITIPPLGINLKRIKIDKSGVADIVDVLNNPLEEPDRQSFIPLEKAEGHFMFIVGKDDHNWKSEFFATEASNRLQAHGKEKPEIVCYPGAGHYIEPPFSPMCSASMHLLVGSPVMWGGEPKAHSVAQVDAWQKIQAFFHKHLSGKQCVRSNL
uniref:Acyl-coenzyme A thioesterase 1-like n=1 Tax=Gopherus evgoodei TaxID=1825980 RepID=A0A8C4WS22_9SAUR